MEEEIRTLKNRSTKLTIENETFDKRIKDNQEAIKMMLINFSMVNLIINLDLEKTKQTPFEINIIILKF